MITRVITLIVLDYLAVICYELAYKTGAKIVNRKAMPSQVLSLLNGCYWVHYQLPSGFQILMCSARLQACKMADFIWN